MELFKQDTAAIFDDRKRAIRAHNLMQWARWATFCLYIVAVFMLYVSDVWGIASFLEKNSNEYVALVVFSVTSFTLAYFLASSKEGVYEDIAINRSEGFRLTGGQKFALVMYALSGILFELFSATANQQHITNNAAEQAGLLKPAEVGSVAINTPPALTDALMKAQASLNKCQELMKQGRMKDCNVSEGKVAGALQAIEMSNQTAATVSGELVDKQNAHNEKLLERFDKPMFKFVGKAVNGDTNDGMIVAVAIMITIFELQHIFAAFAYGNALRRMKAAQGNRAATTPATEPEPQAAPASYLQKAGETVASEMMKAQGARNRVHDQMQQQADKLADKMDKTVSSQPAPANPAPRMSVAETIRALVADVQESGAISPTEIQAATTAAYSRLFNPAEFIPDDLQKVAGKIARDLKPASPNHPTPTTETARRERAETDGQLGIPSDQNTQTGLGIPSLEGALQVVADGLYPAWKTAVKAEEITHAKDPCQKFIWKATASQGEGKQVLSAPETARIWNVWQERAAGEGILDPNPKYQPGNRQPKYILA